MHLQTEFFLAQVLTLWYDEGALQPLFGELTSTLSRFIDIFHTICMWVALWSTFIDDYGNVLAVLVIHWYEQSLLTFSP
jgi:hypothetical protein